MQGYSQDVIFFCTAKYKFGILSYNASTGTVVTEANGDVRVCVCVCLCVRARMSLLPHRMLLAVKCPVVTCVSSTRRAP